MKILVIDDDDRVRRLVTKILASDGHLVLTADNGLHGMTVFRQERPDVVVTDILMPEQEGMETILALRRENPSIKIIAMSGSTPEVGDLDFLKMAQMLGADGVLGKPFRAADLLARIRQLDMPATARTGARA